MSHPHTTPADCPTITVTELVTEMARQPNPVTVLTMADGRHVHLPRPRTKLDRIRLRARIGRELVGKTIPVRCACCGETVTAEVVRA